MLNNTAKFKDNFAVVGDYSDPAHKAAMDAVYYRSDPPTIQQDAPRSPVGPNLFAQFHHRA